MVERRPIQDVNIELGDDVSKIMHEAAKVTRRNRPKLVKAFHPSFSGLRTIALGGLPDVNKLHLYTEADGVGTKIEIAERLEDHSVVAYDLFAMTCDDAVVRGAEPVGIDTILDVKQLDDTAYTMEAIRQLAAGYIAAAEAAGVVVLTGEVAELGDRVGGYGPFNYNWAGSVTWLGHEERLLSGHQIRPEDTLIGLTEEGFRSNGITDVRKAMLDHYGDNWHNQVVKSLGEASLGRLVQKPSTIYSRFIVSLTGGFDIDREPKANVTGIAHITGGGQPSKLGRMLEPSGLGAVIDNPITPPAIMLEIQRLRGFSDEIAYGKWHMGPGMVIATAEPEKVLAEAKAHGITAQRIGHISEQPGIRIKNKGTNQEHEWLIF